MKTTMRIGYLECFAGLSGDMLLGALVDAGVSPALLQKTAASLNLGATLVFESVDRSGISARKARVLVEGHDADAPEKDHHSHPHDHQHHHPHNHSHSHDQEHVPGHTHQHGRNLPAIREILNGAPLPSDARALALHAFELLGHAEAAIHNVPLEQVHFHEVGAVDAIVDIVCAAVGLTSLNIDRWYCVSNQRGQRFRRLCARPLPRARTRHRVAPARRPHLQRRSRDGTRYPHRRRHSARARLRIHATRGCFRAHRLRRRQPQSDRAFQTLFASVSGNPSRKQTTPSRARRSLFWNAPSTTSVRRSSRMPPSLLSSMARSMLWPPQS